MGQRKTRKYRQHPFSERLKAVELYKKGYSSKRIGHLIDLDDSMVRAWLRLYRSKGIEALRPYCRGKQVPPDRQYIRRSENELVLFEPACEAYATSLEPVAPIARRYRPDLVKQREALRKIVVTEPTN